MYKRQVLAAQKKNLKIGVILFDTGNPFFDDVLEGVNRKSRELGGYNCSVLVSRVGFDLEAQLRAMDEMVSQGVNGIVLSPYNDPLICDKINELNAREDVYKRQGQTSQIPGVCQGAYAGHRHECSRCIPAHLLLLSVRIHLLSGNDFLQ